MSVLLLCVQAAIPWFSSAFATQDGPSHLHTAAVVESLVFHGKGPYRNVYSRQRGITTNLGATAVVIPLEWVFGKNHTEQVLWVLVLTVLYAGIVIFVRALGGGWNAMHPITNFLILPWFLWIGFYNFLLGMGLCLLFLAYYWRRAAGMTWRQVLLLHLFFGVLYCVHVMAFFMALLGAGVIAVLQRVGVRRGLAALVPALALLAWVLRGSGSGELLSTDGLGELVRAFPMHAFAAASGRIGEGFYMYTALGVLILLALLVSRVRDLDSPAHGVLLMAAASVGLYLLVPKYAFGGDEVKIRFAWLAFVFGACGVYLHRHFGRVAGAAAVYAAVFVSMGLWQGYQTNIAATEGAVRECLEVLTSVPAGSGLVRLKFSTERTRRHYGFGEAVVEPLFHIESLSAARGHWVSISDYQPLSRLFPVVLKPAIADGHRFELWEMEGATRHATDLLLYLDENLGVPIPYVLLVGDASGEDLQDARRRMEASSKYKLSRTDSQGAFLFLYTRVAAP